MKPSDEKIDSKRSDYYFNIPSSHIHDFFLYPLHIGHFFYLPGFRQPANCFEGFFLMCVQDGTVTLEYGGKRMTAGKDSFLLFHCAQEHSFYSDTGFETVWLHFDGCNALKLYEMAAANLGNSFALVDPSVIMTRMGKIYQPFHRKEALHEVLVSKYINDIMTEFIIYTPMQIKSVRQASNMDNIRSYIRNHIQEDLKIENLAQLAMMSPYHFSRVFKKETGMSPHEYITSYRIQIARTLLLETNLPVNDITFESGFSSDSVFCAAFKKKMGVSPTAFRKSRRI